MTEEPERIWIDDERPIGGELHVFTDPPVKGAEEFVVEYIRADLAEAIVRAWQPIETAPKDGAVFLATHNRSPDNAFCEPYLVCWATPRRRNTDGYTVNNGEPWWLKPCRNWMAPTPTHWMPLPATLTQN
jgi:hypothetical protein